MKKYIQENQDKYLKQLIELLKIPSISADPSYTADVRKAAVWVGDALEEAGCDNIEIIATIGHPIVYAEKILNADFPTVLVYGHYDVQPPDPIELWDSPPFEPVIKKTPIHPEGAIFARGACDDKGQMFMHIKAIELLLENNKLDCNVKFMIEGEEEVGSDNLEKFIKENKEKLKSDIILISDTGIGNVEKPAITTGLRGLSYMEVMVQGPNRDLHSGLYGGTVANPINILSKMIASLHDEKNRIVIPGFYDMVEDISPSDRKEMNTFNSDDEEFKASIGIDATYGEEGYTSHERKSIRPTLDVNGIWGGYTGEGAKTVIPSKAFAKISMRLVPNQKWEEISKLFESHFKNIAPKGVKVAVERHHGGQAYVTPTDNDGYRAAEKAYKEAFGIAPHPKRDGGSIPIVPMFEEVLGCKIYFNGLWIR